jgi:hypothetical protein
MDNIFQPSESGPEIKPKAGSGSKNNNFGSTTLLNTYYTWKLPSRQNHVEKFKITRPEELILIKEQTGKHTIKYVNTERSEKWLLTCSASDTEASGTAVAAETEGLLEIVVADWEGPLETVSTDTDGADVFVAEDTEEPRVKAREL